jgi:DNA polymerase
MTTGVSRATRVPSGQGQVSFSGVRLTPPISGRETQTVPTVYLDFETYGDIDLKKSNVYRYIEDPSFCMLMLGFAVDDDPVRVTTDEDEVRALMADWLLMPDIEFSAHNAGFDRIIMSAVLRLPFGQYLPPEQWDDTMARAAEAGYPRSLENVAKALGTAEKDTAGTRLKNTFSRPVKGRRVLPHEKPEQWAEFVRYCAQDVETLREVARRLPQMSPFERTLWNVDQRVNDRGIRVDLELAHACREASGTNSTDALDEIQEITGVANPNSRDQLLAWLGVQGVQPPDLRADTVTKLLDDPRLPEKPRRVLELRQTTAVASSNKFDAVLRSVSKDSRLRGQFRFHEALTGRWSSKGVQLHNLPRAGFDGEGDEREDAEAEAIAKVLEGQDIEPKVLKKLVRPLMIVDGCGSDFSAIEARVLAWLAGEQWVLDAFEQGRDLYVETAKMMGPNITRSQGKIAVLACGYQGSVGSLNNMGYMEADAPRIVEAWRAANPRIVSFWGRIERAFREGRDVGRLRIIRVGNDRFVRLPSGRVLTYRQVSTGSRLTYAHVHGGRADTYGGRLTENVTQAVARDLLADALVRLDAAGHKIVAHVHDEVLVEGGDPREVQAVMRQAPTWADGLPMDASADTLYRYAKL